MKNLFVLFGLILSMNAHASAVTEVQADKINAYGGTQMDVPLVGTKILSDTSTDTVQNKTIDGGNNTIQNVPVSAIAGSALSGTNTGDVTIGTANGLSLSLQDLSLALASTSTTGALSSTDWNTFNSKLTSTLLSAKIFVGNGSNVATAVTASGDITNDNAGIFTIGAKKVQASKLDSGAAASGTIATSDGSGGVSYSAPAAVAPNIVGTRASPTLITAVGGISFSGSNYQNTNFIAGNGGAVTVTASPQIAAGSSIGQRLNLIGRHATNTVTLADGTGLSLNGTWVGALDSVLGLEWDGTNWLEVFRR